MFDEIQGQAPAVQVLQNALSRGRVHHAYRFEGPPGVGKRKTAFALAQSLVCTQGELGGCGECSSCRRAVELSTEEPHVPQHPDVVLVGRGIYPKNLIGAREATGISVEQIRRVVLSRVGYSPHEARSMVFIVRDAEELTLSAANALLKTLEEPPNRVHFVLLSSRPHRLLDTIRSRSLAVRFGPLSDAVLTALLRGADRNTDYVALARGSARAAFELSDDEQRERLDQFAAGVISAIESPNVAESLDFASKLSSDRHELREQLQTLAQLFAIEGRQLALADPEGAETKALQYTTVQDAVTALERNVAPTLALEAMLLQLRRPGPRSPGLS